MIIIVQYNCNESGSWAHAHSPHCLLHHSTLHPPPTPRTWTNHWCSSFTALLKQPLHSHSWRSLVLPRLTFWALFLFLWPARVWPWTVYPRSLLPALVILLLEVPIVLLPALTPARYCLRLCLASDISDTDGWSLPVWPCLSLLKQDCKWIHTPQTLRYNNTVH